MKGSPEREEEKEISVLSLWRFSIKQPVTVNKRAASNTSPAEDDDNADQKSINSRDDGGAALMGRAP